MRLPLAQLLVVALLCLPAIAQGAPVDVTCGDTVYYRDARLTGNCTGSIKIVSGKLSLQGYTISGTGLAAIECQGGCRVTGPGSIVSAGSIFGVSGDDRIRVTEVTISGHDSTGVNSGYRGIQVTDSIVTNNGVGVRGTRIRVRSSTISDNVGSGIVATTRGVNLKSSFILNNGGDGVATVLSDDFGNLVKASYSAVRGNGNFGILAKNISARRTVVLDNSQNAACGTSQPCTDLAAVRRPKLGVVTCNTSMQIPEQFSGPIPFGASWHVCRNDPAPTTTSTSTTTLPPTTTLAPTTTTMAQTTTSLPQTTTTVAPTTTTVAQTTTTVAQTTTTVAPTTTTLAQTTTTVAPTTTTLAQTTTTVAPTTTTMAQTTTTAAASTTTTTI